MRRLLEHDTGSPMTDQNDAIDGGKAEDIHREAVDHLVCLAAKAAERLPALVHERRGTIPTTRLPDRCLDGVFALKLIQLVGNLQSGDLLVRHGHYFEWDMVHRLIDETLDDLEFLARGEAGNWTEIHDRYMDALFAEDFNEDGSVVQESVRAPQRRQIADYLSRATNDGNEAEVAAVRRNIARLNNASAHGRISGILRSSYQAGEQRFWLGGSRSGVNASLERLSFHMVAAQTTASIGYLICPRWWGEACTSKTVVIAQRLHSALGPMRARVERHLASSGDQAISRRPRRPRR